MSGTLNPDTPIGQLAAAHPEWMPIFDRFGLDYCCGGGRTLRDACETTGAPLDEVIAACPNAPADAPARAAAAERNWLDASMSELADHIEATHHAFARHAFARLGTLVRKVAAAHGDERPSLHELERLVASLADDMHEHMIREERVVFPWLRRLERHTEIHTGPPWSIRRPISCMIHDHDDVAAGFAEARRLTDGYTAPPGACNTFRAMIDLLRDLEHDTRVHIHKENNILFPAGIRAEERRRATDRPAAPSPS